MRPSHFQSFFVPMQLPWPMVLHAGGTVHVSKGSGAWSEGEKLYGKAL